VVLQQLSGAYLLLLTLAACCSCEYSIDVVSQLLLGQKREASWSYKKMEFPNHMIKNMEKKYGKSPFYSWVNQLFLRPFSIANC